MRQIPQHRRRNTVVDPGQGRRRGPRVALGLAALLLAVASPKLVTWLAEYLHQTVGRTAMGLGIILAGALFVICAGITLVRQTRSGGPRQSVPSRHTLRRG